MEAGMCKTATTGFESVKRSWQRLCLQQRLDSGGAGFEAGFSWHYTDFSARLKIGVTFGRWNHC